MYKISMKKCSKITLIIVILYLTYQIRFNYKLHRESNATRTSLETATLHQKFVSPVSNKGKKEKQSEYLEPRLKKDTLGRYYTLRIFIAAIFFLLRPTLECFMLQYRTYYTYITVFQVQVKQTKISTEKNTVHKKNKNRIA